jgi:hypothetical protein
MYRTYKTVLWPCALREGRSSRKPIQWRWCVILENSPVTCSTETSLMNVLHEREEDVTPDPQRLAATAADRSPWSGGRRPSQDQIRVPLLELSPFIPSSSLLALCARRSRFACSSPSPASRPPGDCPTAPSAMVCITIELESSLHTAPCHECATWLDRFYTQFTHLCNDKSYWSQGALFVLHGSEPIQILLEPFYHGIGKYLICNTKHTVFGFKGKGDFIGIANQNGDENIWSYSTVPFKLNFWVATTTTIQHKLWVEHRTWWPAMPAD